MLMPTHSIVRNIAIATDDFQIHSQTFIRRHVNLLFDGRTVLIRTKYQLPGKRFEKPTLICAKPRRFTHRLHFLLCRLLRTDKCNTQKMLRDFIATHHVDFLLAEFGYVGLKIYSHAEKAGLPMYCYFRGADASKRLLEPGYVQRLKAMMPHIAGIVAVSKYLVENLQRHGITHPVTHVIPSGVDTQTFVPTTKDPDLLVAIGRFIPKKAPDITICAFAALAKEYPSIRLEMVGDGECLETCQALAKKLGVASRVIFHGPQSHEFVCELLGRSHIFMQHSIVGPDGDTEGFPTAIQEAMAAGALVISSRHAGTPEHIENNANGLLVDEGDLASYIAALRQALSDSELSKKISANAREYAVRNLDFRINYARLQQAINQELIEAQKNIQRLRAV